MIVSLSANSCWYLYNFRKNTITSLIQAGYEVTCIAPPDQYATKLIKLGCKHQPIALFPDGTNPIQELVSLLKLRALLKKLKPAIYLTFNPKLNIYGGIASRTLKINHIANISGLGSLNNKNIIIKIIYFFLYRLSLSSSKHIFFQNNHDKKIFCNFKIVNPSRASRLMGSGVDLQKFSYQMMPPTPPTKFVFVGRLIEQKGVRAYVKAAQRLMDKYPKRAEYSIIGILEPTHSKRAITVNELNDWENKHNIRYRGASDDVASDVAINHVIVIPTSYSEGVPRVALEGASVGRLVIISDLPGCRETVEEGVTGFLCNPKKIDSIFDAMETALNLEEAAKIKMGAAARSRMEALFNEEHNIEAYLSQIKCNTSGPTLNSSE